MKSKKIFLCAFILFFVTLLCSCKNENKQKLTRPEYIKEVVVLKSKFDDMIGDFLDQVDTYSGTKESTQRLNSLAEQLESYVRYIKDNLGPIVPEESKKHYDDMMLSYNIYLESVNIYKENLPKDLGDERNNAISLAESKLKQANDAMMNIK